MKKLMIAAAIVCAAAFAQAATIDWSLDAKSICSPLEPEEAHESFTAYLLAFDSTAAADSLYTAIKTGTTTLDSAKGSAIGEYFTDASGKSAGSIDKETASNAAKSGGETGYFAILVANGSDQFILSDAIPAKYYDAAVEMYKDPTQVSFIEDNFSTEANVRTGWTTIAGPGPVPEPTSGLLLLLGVAGLALRRKQK